MVGTSLFALKKMRDVKSAASRDSETSFKKPGIIDSVKGVFAKAANAVDTSNSLDFNLSLTIPSKEALVGTNKKISYEVDGNSEQLMIRIPEKFPNGGKLRIKEKGHRKNGKRGDLILQVKVNS